LTSNAVIPAGVPDSRYSVLDAFRNCDTVGELVLALALAVSVSLVMLILASSWS